MRFTENRRLGLIVLAVCVLVSVCVLGPLGLSSERRDLVKVFTNGAESASGTRQSMDAYLDKCSESARLLAESAKVFLGDDASAQAVLDSAAALEAMDGPDGRYEAYKTLTSSVESLYTKLTQAGAQEETDVLLSYGDFKGACDRLDRDEYHGLAQKFNADLSSFPANVLGGLFGIKKLDTFGW